MSLEALSNVREYVSAHYLAEILPRELKTGLLASWAKQEKAHGQSPRLRLRTLGKEFFAVRPQLDQDGQSADVAWRKALNRLHESVLISLGFTATRELITVDHSGSEQQVPVLHHDRDVVAIECGWATDVDAALDAMAGGRLPQPVSRGPEKPIETGVDLASFLFATDEPPRYVLILTGAIVILADRYVWGDSRYLAANLDTALGRYDTSAAGELDTLAALFSAESLRSPLDGGANPLSELVDSAQRHAVGVSADLRSGLQRSVELIANEVLARIRAAGLVPEQLWDVHDLARRLNQESLRYLYRVLFLLYAEARPELGVLPADYPEYAEGYGMARLGELVTHPLTDETARTGFHLYESLDLLVRLVNGGHRTRSVGETVSSQDEGIRFEKLNSDLFSPAQISMIGRADNPAWDRDEPCATPQYIDTRLRNETLHAVLRLLMIVRGRKKERGGFVSYAKLGINQLGAVYEGVMSYTGFIANEELYEVAKGGDNSNGSWMIPATRADHYPDDVFVLRDDDVTGEKRRVRHPAGSFVYRLAGRERLASASYYTPKSLTEATVRLALEQRIKENPAPIHAADLLKWTICEPALGSGAFLNEAIDQIAEKYLQIRKKELGDEIPVDSYEAELRRVKAYIALHNSYGVDLNQTAVELAEVSLWLNVMHPGLAAPWFGLHLRRGNSLIGANRRYYTAKQLPLGEWLRAKDPLAPTGLPFRDGDLPRGAVHQFLLPASGWGVVTGEKEARALAPDEVAQLAAWRKKIQGKPKKGKQVQRLQALARRTEFLWDLVVRRLEISEQEISRDIALWGAEGTESARTVTSRQEVYDDLHAEGTPYWRLKTLMNTWCALWFWPVNKASMLDGTASLYADSWQVAVEVEPSDPTLSAETVAPPFAEQASLLPALQGTIFGEPEVVTSSPKKAPRPRAKVTRRPVIPLLELDDWLDFAEALLGSVDLGEDNLFSDIATLKDLDQIESELPGQMGMDTELKLPQRFPWLVVVEDIASRNGFFHWELDFAHIFKSGGFDLQVGNPPWVRPEWDESVVLAEDDPWFGISDLKTVPDATKRSRKSQTLAVPRAREHFLGELAAQAATAEYLSSRTTYSLLAGTQPDFYRGFMIRTWANLSPHGIVGILHPDTHFSGSKEGLLRAASYRHLRIHGDFMNAGNRFFATPVSRTLHFGLHIYGNVREISFQHLSWLFDTSTLTRSIDTDSSIEDLNTDRYPIGVKLNGQWDIRPHQSRVITVDSSLLRSWSRFNSEGDVPFDQAKLLSPVSTREQEAIGVLGSFSDRLGAQGPQISRGYDEKGAKDDGLIEWKVGQVQSWTEVILQGPHLGVATPFFKQAPNMRSSDRPQDLTRLAADALPGTNYRRAVDLNTYQKAQDSWLDFDQQSERRYTGFYRLSWREMIASNTDRSLFAALIPPGATHVHAVRSMILSSTKTTALASGFWASLPLDYLLRTTGTGHLDVSNASSFPAATETHPLASSLLLRTLRMNCLTGSYDALWSELFDPSWQEEAWSVEWPAVPALGTVDSHWTMDTPLRTEMGRRAALVEIDALVSVWLGLSADQLATIYLSRYPVLSDYEDVTWFDANGRKIAGNFNTYGHGQTKEHFQQLVVHLEDDAPPPDGYTPPFYKADRVSEMRLAHAVFSNRLKESR